ncbi:glutaminase domain-containing protein [Acidicapsa dinghuensis]|uniref:Glutaminase domain-containing protein n=1 Tax=Acidicapsa dinghuensis TaxID=2218256 RepID=A0ABW1EC97_9BACT
MAAGLCVSTAMGQERAPATPLIAHDPYFSVWSFSNDLTGSNTVHWTGHEQPIAGIAQIDGKAYRFMGRDPDNVPAMQQVESKITATHTRYVFKQSGVELDLTFFTPAMMDDLDVLSRPVTYVTWSAKSIDGAGHQVSVLIDVDPVIAVNDRGEKVVTTRNQTSSLNVLSVGSRDQEILNRSGDNLRIDWGYFHLAVPKDEQAMTAVAAHTVDDFVKDRTLPANDSIGLPEAARDDVAHLAVATDLGSVNATPVERHVLVSYADGFSIQYLERNLRPYWQRNHKTVAAMLDEAAAQYGELEQKGAKFDSEFEADMTKAGGEHYAWIATLAYRQAIAAHKLAADVSGEPMLFPKENFSNGCISTVDVIYPSAPIFLFFQPKLVEALLLPVLEYSSLARWKFPFAPHDLGQYPLANGQVYGGGERTEDDQMPVEESGNMIILVDALARAQGNAHLAEKYWPQLTKWADFLKAKGLDPENQLTTDDFAGHVAHNANLSVKAIDALAAYADLAKMLKHEDVAKEYRATAESMAQKWVGMAQEGDHYKLAFNSPGTWSQKYNLVWDEVLDYHLFPNKVRDTEIAYYLTKLNQYGLPLDSRKDYTKLDWTIWTATMASSPDQFKQIIDPVYKWTNETTTRVPLTDWYDTKNGKQIGFQARSVVGGVFIKALADKELTAKWREKAGH